MGFIFNDPKFIIGTNDIPSPIQMFKSFVIGGAVNEPTWQDIIVSGVGSITLVNAKANGLNYVKLFGKCEQSAENLATVTAEGKTVQTDGLPSEYQRVEYIQSTGTQFINTGFVIPDLTNKYKVHYRMTVDGGTQPSSSQNVKGYTGANGILSIAYTRDYGLGSSGEGVPVVANHIYDITQIRYADASRSTVIDDTTITNSNQSTAYDDRPYCIFNLSPLDTNNFRIYGKIYEFQAYKNDLIQMNLLPCRRVSDSVLGMYDTVSGNFFTNEGTDTFIAGNDVTVPTPAIPIPLVCNNGTLKFRSKSGLPAGYIKLDYLQGGNGTYIDTGIIPTSNVLHVKWKGQLSGSTYGGSFYGCSTSTTPRAGFRFFSNAITGKFNIQSYSNLIEVNGGFDVVDCDVTYDVTNLTINGRINNTTISETNANINTTFNKNMLLFGAYIGDKFSTSGEQKCWWLQVEKDGVLVQNLVPCMRAADSVLGMYDTVSGLLFTNVGTGSFTAGNIDYTDIEMYTDGTQETITDTFNNSATAENLLSVDTYKDIQEVLSGAITRNVGVKVLDGTETITKSIQDTSPLGYYFGVESSDISHIAGATFVKTPAYCTHFTNVVNTIQTLDDGTFTVAVATNKFYMAYSGATTDTEFATWLAQQYQAGTPVILVYPLATATTESVTGQALYREPLTVTGSIDNLTVNVTTTASTTPSPTNPIPIKCNNGELKIKNKYLPLEYQEVDGLIGDGEAYIDLDTGLTQNDIIEIKFSISSATAKEGIFGGRTNASTNNIAVAFANNNNSEIVADFNNSNYTSYRLQQSLTPDIIYTLLISKNKRAIYNGDTLVAQNATVCNDTITVSNCFLFAIAGYPAYQDKFTGTIYSCKIKNKRNVIPCRRNSDNVLGMYDTITDTFFTNAGTGNFTAGANVITDYELYVDGITETVEDSLGNTATAENLLSVDIYKDEQEVLTGEVTYKTMTYVVDGTEDWDKYRANNGYSCFRISSGLGLRSKHRIGISNYLPYYNVTTASLDREAFTIGSNMTAFYITLADEDMTLEEFTDWLKGLCKAGRPFIVVLPRYTSVTSTVTPQTLTTQAGTNIIEITQASIDGLPLEVSYKGGVTVTVEEVENVNLDNSVTVTIGE